ncbi:MAG: GNAT family N-acetyltransferase [Candidatus Bathyarchaeia archaeon]|jgi:GNAT superfamily N-acetyltransferase
MEFSAKTKRGETIKLRRETRSNVEFDQFSLSSDLYGQIGKVVLEIYYKPTMSDDEDYLYPSNSAALFDIEIFEESLRRQGRGSELLDIMIQYAKSRGATKFFAVNVPPEYESWYAKRGFTPTDDRDRWYREI